MFMKEKKFFLVNKEVFRKVIRVLKIEEIKYVIFLYIFVNEIKIVYF